jgi:hypothetical protein
MWFRVNFTLPVTAFIGRRLVAFFSFPRSRHKPRKPWVFVEFLVERYVVALLPLNALGAIEVRPIHLLLVCVRSFAHFRENAVTKRGYLIESP